MISTDAGISMEDRPVQSEKAKSLISVTSLGITVFLQPEINLCSSVLIMALQPLGELYTGLPASTVIEASGSQP